MSRRRAWLLSAYRACSHVHWADWLTRSLDEFDWHRLELPGRHFAWRIRGNPLSWLDALPAQTPDLLVATSMVDLATLKGLHPHLSRVPAVYYFHENQFAYPESSAQTTSAEAQMVQVYGALAADRVLFNSDFNRRTFLTGVKALAERVPGPVPGGLVERLEAKSGVLPVPIEPITSAKEKDLGLIVWAHRWEYDRRPERFSRAMLELAGRGADFRLALLGPRPPKKVRALAALREALGQRIVADGLLPADEYRAVLARAGIAVSTSDHEFQGLAMLEAASAAVRPLVPDALCYPEIFPADYRYPPGDPAALVEWLWSWLKGELPAAVDVEAWTGPALRPHWRACLETACRCRAG